MSRTDTLNGMAKEAKSVVAKNYDTASQFGSKVEAKLEETAVVLADQVNLRAQEAAKLAQDYAKLAKEYSRNLADYTQKHPWRVGLTVAGIGALVGAYLMRKK